jgi:Fe-S-cluster containining protein
VPISESEAHALAVLVAAMPEPRRSTIRARFADALHRFAEVGLIEGLRDPVNIPDAELRSFGMAYFDTGVPCPFLEDESCSIYENRPAACREYLVMSPAEECKHPKPTTIRQILLPITISRLIRDLEDRQWVPMIVALEWSASHAEAAARPGTVLVEEFFRKLIEASQLPPS